MRALIREHLSAILDTCTRRLLPPDGDMAGAVDAAVSLMRR